MRSIVFASVAQTKSNDFCEAIAKPFSSLMGRRVNV